MLVKHNEKEIGLLARLMRAEAVGEGNLGMLMVGNVGLNRIIANCYTFKNIKTITDMVYQNPGGFSAVNSSLFYSNPTTSELNLAKRVLRGEYYYPATNSLWFYAPKNNANCSPNWFNQPLSGKYKNHCFYKPDKNICRQLY